MGSENELLRVVIVFYNDGERQQIREIGVKSCRNPLMEMFRYSNVCHDSCDDDKVV